MSGIHTEEHRRKVAEANTRHGHYFAGFRSPTYNSWRAMKDRCLNPNHTKFAKWGGRGITICERWLKFENFLADMGERPDGKTLDRHPNGEGNYEPGNARWATVQEQADNRKPVEQWAKPVRMR